MASWWIGKKFKCIPVPNSIQISIKPGILWNTNKIILTTSLSSVLIRVRLLLAEEWQTRILSLAPSTLHGINGWIVFEIALLLSVAITVLVLILSTRYLNKYGKSSLVRCIYTMIIWRYFARMKKGSQNLPIQVIIFQKKLTGWLFI